MQKKSELTETELASFSQLRADMLGRAGECYREAGICQEDELQEEWLQHYMLGKVAEKSAGAPSQYLHHYMQVGVGIG